jgi:hypothetical protein
MKGYSLSPREELELARTDVKEFQSNSYVCNLKQF